MDNQLAINDGLHLIQTFYSMKKYKVGYTTGVYDMFHIGHLNILRRAKEQCETLIVGVSTDENVERYKHKTPVIPFEHRKAIVEAIRYVDQVVPQENMDKYAAWEKYRFDAIFHGDDWKGSSMYDEIEKKLRAVGCDMVFLPHTDGVSSTDIVKKIHG
jgi:glycerol-3-phosphate cytidylyltransferase